MKRSRYKIKYKFDSNIQTETEFIKYCYSVAKFGIYPILKCNNLLDYVTQSTQFLDEIYPNPPFSQRLYHIINDVPYGLRCPVCGSPLKFQQAYKTTCGKSTCLSSMTSIIQSNPDMIKKKEETMIKRYGVAYSIQNPESNQKRIKTVIEKYGVDSASKSDIVKKKVAETNLRRYGSKTPLGNAKVRAKMHQTNLRRYGVKEYGASLECKKKSMETCRQKYGTDYYMLTKNFESISKPFISTPEKYKSLTERNFREILENDGMTHNYTYVEYDANVRKHILKCHGCNNTFEIGSLLYRKRMNYGHVICTNCNPVNKPISIQEKELLDFVKSNYNGEIIHNDRSVIHPYELDIYLPDLRLAIEYNGNYWHANPKFYNVDDKINIKGIEYFVSDIWKKDQRKLEFCNNKNITLITVWEDDWTNSKNKIKNKIKKLIKDFLATV